MVTDVGLSNTTLLNKTILGHQTGIFYDKKLAESISIKVDLFATKIGAKAEGVAIDIDALGLSVMPIFLIAGGVDQAGLILGCGLYGNMLTNDQKLFKKQDFGGALEVGVEWKYLSVFAAGKIGFLDQVEILDGSQRFRSFGLGIRAHL